MITPGELGPLLGRLTSLPTAADGAAVLLEPVRVQLLTDLFERNAAARRGGTELAPATWLTLWSAAVDSASVLALTEAARRVREAAQLSRFPSRSLGTLLPTSDDHVVLAARSSAAGTGLEAEVESGSPEARRLAGELERAWDLLGATIRVELNKWEVRAAGIRAWRRPWRSLVIGGVTAGLVALWVGLILGGYLPVPPFLQPVAEWYWSLPWP